MPGPKSDSEQVCRLRLMAASCSRQMSALDVYSNEAQLYKSEEDEEKTEEEGERLDGRTRRSVCMCVCVWGGEQG